MHASKHVSAFEIILLKIIDLNIPPGDLIDACRMFICTVLNCAFILFHVNFLNSLSSVLAYGIV